MSHYDGIREADLNAECDRLRAENAALRRLAQTLQAERIDLEDCREGLRALGDLCGCDHVESPDDRAQQVRHIREAFADLRRQVEEAQSVAHCRLESMGRDVDRAEQERDKVQSALTRIATALGLPDADPERVAGEVERLKEAERLLGCGHVALALAVKWAAMLLERWDNDEDSKVGKGLKALAGESPRYSPDTDGIHAFICEIAEYRNTRAAAEAANKERSEG